MERNNRNAWIGFGVLALLILVGLSTLGAGMMGYPFGHMLGERWALGGPGLWRVGAFGLLVRLLVWGALIFWAVRFFRHAASAPDEQIGHSDVSALEILKRRYASGEITRDQYDAMRSVLESP